MTRQVYAEWIRGLLVYCITYTVNVMHIDRLKILFGD